jgi:hypothetical protein
MNRRLTEDFENQPRKRHKTAETRILNSKKLPHDFFSSKKSLTSSEALNHKKNNSSLPILRMPLDKSKCE